MNLDYQKNVITSIYEIDFLVNNTVLELNGYYHFI
jgi:hypothetical protein